MSFTSPTITHSFLTGGGAAAAGTVEFSLITGMTNGTQSILEPAIVTGTLDSSGDLSVQVTSNLDAGTQPAAPWNSTWRVDIQVTGAQAQSYVITVPPIQTETQGSIASGALNTVVLKDLTVALFMVGQSITGSNIPTGTIITAVDQTTNSVTISNNGTAGTGLSLTLGSTIDLGYLLPTVPQPL